MNNTEKAQAGTFCLDIYIVFISEADTIWKPELGLSTWPFALDHCAPNSSSTLPKCMGFAVKQNYILSPIIRHAVLVKIFVSSTVKQVQQKPVEKSHLLVK